MISPKRPYFVRAMHEWLTDHNFTPYLMVDIHTHGVHAPTQYAQEGRLVLAISYQATKDLFMDNTAISFSARFGGVSEDVWIPMQAVIGIYAKEDSNHGLFFDPNEYDGYTPPPSDEPNNRDDNDEPPRPTHLKFV